MTFSEKLDSALKTIGEVAEEVGVPEYVLRFWETKFKHIAPMKSRGRRYYDGVQIGRLIELRDLLYKQGLTIKGAQNYFKNPNKEAVSVKVATNNLGNEERQKIATDLMELRHKLISALN